MGRHLVESVEAGWSFLGTDLLDGAPDDLRAEVIGPRRDPSRELSGPGRYVVNGRDTRGLQWVYVLRPHGVEVIGLEEHRSGPVVPWDTDPCSRFGDSPRLWSPKGRLPVDAGHADQARLYSLRRLLSSKEAREDD
ncbi:hypothetical protein ACWC5I_39565 [Kitasatospora sp. NPDC001574]